MAEVTVVVGLAALFAAAFVTWYTMGHRPESRLEKVRVETTRSGGVVRRDDGVGGDG